MVIEPQRRTGLAAVLSGLLFFAGQAGELIFGSPSRAVNVLWVLLAGAGLIALAIAVWGLRPLVRTNRRGRAGWWLATAGAALLILFAVQAAISVTRTGQVPENFVLFLLGFLLLAMGQSLFAANLRRPIGWAWIMPLVAVLGLIVALTATDALGPTHDIGLFLFEAAWVVLGIALMRHGFRMTTSTLNETAPSQRRR
ncbi:MAG TPA: hypothetical protein VFP89_16195 [Propionibacteriaceae bacterium]|nr:hypothetical protein [Propionibacteriaceae bacterium]